jgi:hypothetical protein
MGPPSRSSYLRQPVVSSKNSRSRTVRLGYRVLSVTKESGSCVVSLTFKRRKYTAPRWN